jgi:hypothetical protein
MAVLTRPAALGTSPTAVDLHCRSARTAAVDAPVEEIDALDDPRPSRQVDLAAAGMFAEVQPRGRREGLTIPEGDPRKSAPQ